MTESACLASINSGELIGEPWRIWHWDDTEHAARLEAAIERDGLPWFSRMHDRDRIAEFLLTRPGALAPSQIVLLALLEEGIGRDAACERMALLIRHMSGLSPCGDALSADAGRRAPAHWPGARTGTVVLRAPSPAPRCSCRR